MRLTEVEVSSIVGAVEAFLPKDFKGSLVLYGSRVDDSLRGGDIDLVLIVETEGQMKTLKSGDYKIVAAIKSRPAIGDRKIDFKVLSVAESQTGFFAEALKRSIVLWPSGARS